MFRIGEFARLGGVSARMLRAWDELGLFRPAWVDPVTGYRSYSPAQLPELRRLPALRAVGVPPAELARLFDRLELVEPGLVSSTRWRPEATPFGEPEEIDQFCALGRKP